LGTLRLGSEPGSLSVAQEGVRMKYEEILEFWFGHVPGRELGARGAWQLIGRLPYWAGKWGSLVRDVDGHMRRRFSADLEHAAAGQYDHWAAEPAGLLALLVLLDQFPRNIHRGTPAAFANDQKAYPLALRAVDNGMDQHFYPVARSFFYLPLVHREDLESQNRAVEAYRRAAQEARGIQKLMLRTEYLSSLRHRQAIELFGRFPHRNEILGRETTEAEARFLRQPFTRF
jgi:uncharacterized protein (DUF924 family)